MSDFESPSATTTQEANTPENRATTLFAQGLIELLQPLVVDCEAKVQNVTQSQVNLSTKIDHLSEGLLLLPFALPKLFFFPSHFSLTLTTLFLPLLLFPPLFRTPKFCDSRPNPSADPLHPKVSDSEVKIEQH
eukprot:TRINITY_DN918_c0_g1_i1.p1 TRINITY_DN918_c0_g1~~TRINITY_DN918_c0_g1_i1.p1  ORF type:complete len:133 (-),score=22.49 TRINITY_DN918_c0_g1_i1:109-507(-)